jgi:hypothetical protein
MANCILAQHWLTLGVFFLIHIYYEKYLICDCGGAMNFFHFVKSIFKKHFTKKRRKKILKSHPKPPQHDFFGA